MVNESNGGGKCSLSCSAEACCYIMYVWVICPRGMAVTVKGAMSYKQGHRTGHTVFKNNGKLIKSIRLFIKCTWELHKILLVSEKLKTCTTTYI